MSENAQTLPAGDPNVTAEWMMEEAGELIRASNTGEALDALFDVLGIILMALSAEGGPAMTTALAQYRAAQTERGRPLSTPHQLAIVAAVDALKRAGRSDLSRDIIHNRGKRFDAKARAAHVKALNELTAAFKATRKPDPASP
jgi:hypothetical protein